MFSVVEFEDNSVSVVHQAWFNGNGQVYFPDAWNNHRTRMLINGIPPPKNAKYHPFRLHKSTDDYAEACRWEEMLAENNCLFSSDATTPMRDSSKRIRKPHVYEGYELEPSNSTQCPRFTVDIEYDEPPPKLILRQPSEACCTKLVSPTCTTVRETETPKASGSHNFVSERDEPPKLPVECEKSEAKYMIEILEKLNRTDHEILHEVRALRKEVATLSSRLPVPSTENLRLRLPMSSLEDMDVLEDQLLDASAYQKLIDFLSTAGGCDGNSLMWNILGMLLTLPMAGQISWRRLKGKKSIEHKHWVRAAIECTMAKNFPLVTREFLHERIQAWIHKKREVYQRILQRQEEEGAS